MTHEIWRLANGWEPGFARVIAWDSGQESNTCAQCGRSDHSRGDLQCSWTDDSARLAIGDFTWNAPNLLVRASVAERLKSEFTGFRVRPLTTHGRRKVGDRDIVELEATTSLPALAKSTLVERYPCRVCGRTTTLLEGAEELGARTKKGGRFHVRVKRRPRMGLFIPRDALDGIGAFKVERLGGVFATSAFRRFVLDADFTNIDFYEAGTAVKASARRATS